MDSIPALFCNSYTFPGILPKNPGFLVYKLPKICYYSFSESPVWRDVHVSAVQDVRIIRKHDDEESTDTGCITEKFQGMSPTAERNVYAVFGTWLLRGAPTVQGTLGCDRFACYSEGV